jgi:hypothetical protein
MDNIENLPRLSKFGQNRSDYFEAVLSCKRTKLTDSFRGLLSEGRPKMNRNEGSRGRQRGVAGRIVITKTVFSFCRAARQTTEARNCECSQMNGHPELPKLIYITSKNLDRPLQKYY